MLDGSYICQIFVAAFFMMVGVRLLRLSRLTREAPEKLLGIYFFLTGLSYVGWQLPVIFHLEASANPLDLATWTLYGIGVVPFLLFARTVFRPNTAWANGIVVSCTLMLLAGTGSWIIHGHAEYALDRPLFWCNWLGYTIPCLWVSIEAFLAYTRAKRRVRVGLCDRVVANRFLLFGWFGTFQTFACITDIFFALDYMVSNTVSSGLDLALGVLEMVGIVMLFLAFFPPVLYQRWISADTAPAVQTVDG